MKNKIAIVKGLGIFHAGKSNRLRILAFFLAAVIAVQSNMSAIYAAQGGNTNSNQNIQNNVKRRLFMRRKLFTIIICLSLILTYFPVSADSSSSIVADSNIRVFMDGTKLTFKDTPILKNGHLMLTNELFKYLGVKPQDQVWNKNKTQITLNNSKKKVTIDINANYFVYYGMRHNVTEKPFIYNGKMYYSFDDVATMFEIRYDEDEDPKTYFLRDMKQYRNNSYLISKVDKAMDKLRKYKITELGTIKFGELELYTKTTRALNNEVKLQSRLEESRTISSNYDYDRSILNITRNYFYKDGREFVKFNDDDGWSDLDIGPSEYASKFKFSDMMWWGDRVATAMTTSNGTKKDEIVLKGNINVWDGFDGIEYFLRWQLGVDKIYTKYFEVFVNKNTYIVNKIHLKMTGHNDHYNQDVTIDYVVDISDINGKFDIVVPDQIK